MKIRVVRVKPNTMPFMDEIEVSDDNIYQIKSKWNEQEYTYSLELNRRNIELKFIELEPNVVAICFNEKTLTNVDGKYYRGISDYYDVDEEVVKNREVHGEMVFGEFIIVRILPCTSQIPYFRNG